MKDSVSYTALIMAAKRAIESTRPDRLFDDPFAAQLAGEEVDILIQQWASMGKELEFAKIAYTRYVAVRTRFFDEFVLSASAEAQQLVILGAGMDTRAFRLPWATEMQIYEVDRPEIMTYKESILKDAPLSCQRQSIALDLTDDWVDALCCQGYQCDRPSIWLLEGLLMYLPEATVHPLLQTIAALTTPGSRLGVDLISVRSLECALRSQGRVRRHWQFATNEPEQLLAQYGWAATVVEPGDPTADFGRCPDPPLPRHIPGKRRSFLATARKR
ncbi:SAM-dependent methyltransferase [Oscillatoria sp. FACHB-1407]|uniref:SAM-dependent methyltransferase n=1 Tax=Oscillatoria sp. FACHB-1407 TaxID=2692847 RepID=UPI001689F1D7|nr:SAM-dependent methyltransferase [Oscillatoria sp. FACHB-1407]MBD2459868.1 SAM-dependent methyltransferase [Oscillatoria sp. FACHB-1407]